MRILIITLVLLTCSLEAFAQSTAAYPDNSFDTATYVYLGIPSISKTWDEKLLKQFVNYMEQVYKDDKWSLPRKNSSNSGLLFSKMIDKNLLEPILNKSIVFSERIDYINTMMEYSNFIATIYQESNRKTERFGREVLATYVFMMQFTDVVRRFMDELKSTLPKEVSGQADFLKMHDGSTQQVFDLLKNAFLILEKDVERYDNFDLSDFARQTAKATTKSWELLNDKQQKELKVTIKKLRKHENKAVKKEIKKLIKEVK